jgi:alpha-mannosidase
MELYSCQERITFNEAVKQQYKPTQIGAQLGPTWSSHWFKMSIDIAPSAKGRCILMFDSSSEALIWSKDGEPLQGLTGYLYFNPGGHGGDRHVDFCLLKDAKGGEHIDLWIEVAANGMFGAGLDGMINAPDPNRYFTLETVEVKIPNEIAFSLFYDFQVLIGMAKELSRDEQTASDALYCGNAMINAIRFGEPSSLLTAKQISAEFFQKRAKTGYSPHVISAVGNCHIDTAWRIFI